MKKSCFSLSFFLFTTALLQAQLLLLPNSTNEKSWAGRRIGVTDVEIRWSAPGVKGREGKIWGTPVAHYGYTDLQFGSSKAAPWRAGADENTTVSFSTDVKIEGQPLPAGKYGFFIALYPDSCTLIFSKNADAWGSYFYKPEEDALHVTVRQQKNRPQSVERLMYTFSEITKNSMVVALEWEYWRIPFTISVDFEKTTLASIRRQLSGEMGFDAPSLQSAAQWCLTNNINLEEALFWATQATNPVFGNAPTFAGWSTRADLERQLGRTAEADKSMQTALENAGLMDMHRYGRQLIAEKKYNEALAVFQKNYDKHKGAWPTTMGLARGYSAVGNLTKALEYAKAALPQAPDAVNKTSVQKIIDTLNSGKAIEQ